VLKYTLSLIFALIVAIFADAQSSMKMKLILEYNVKKANAEINNPTLIVQLHGVGSNKDDLFSFANELSSNFIVVSAQAPNEYYMGFAWYNLQVSNDGYWSDIPQAKASVEKIDQFIEYAINQYSTEPKVILMGFSQGAIMSIATALKYPEKIKAVVAMSGYYNGDIVAVDPNNLLAKKIPFFAVHGIQDDVIPVTRAKESYKNLESHFTNYSFKEYPLAHGISNESLTDVVNWINNL
tara:strand:- start:1122 stop:1835 length:714 start_codon:yes stop_codon:yes gene_type:complete